MRVVSSGRAGMGKSLYIQRLVEKFEDPREHRIEDPREHRIVTLHGPEVDNDLVVKILRESTKPEDYSLPIVFHLDISEKVIV